MLKKIILLTTIAAALASNQARAQGLGSVNIQNSPLQLEVGRNSPILAVIPAKSQVELLAYELDKSENRCQESRHYLQNNLYIKVSYNGLTGFIPAYFLSESEALNRLKTMAFPNNNPTSGKVEKEKENNKDSKPSGKDKGKKTK